MPTRTGKRNTATSFCNLEGDDCWCWSARVYDGIQWIDFTVQDAALDPTGEAETWGENADGSRDSIRFSYGATVVRAGKSDEYALAMEPFLGLEVPDSTRSD